jgi:hypothetical protein
VSYLHRALRTGSLEDRVFALQTIARAPTGDAVVRSAIEPLLDDVSPCVLQIPYRFGELRYLAAAALVAERCAAGDGEPLLLRCTAPLTADELAQRWSAAELPENSGCRDPTELQLEWFAVLRNHQLLAKIAVEFRCSGTFVVG